MLKSIGDEPTIVTLLGPCIAHDLLVEEVHLNDAKASFQERMIADDTSTALVEVSGLGLEA